MLINILNLVALIITILGSFNCFLINIMNHNIVSHFFHGYIEKICYFLFVISAIYCIKFITVINKHK